MGKTPHTQVGEQIMLYDSDFLVAKGHLTEEQFREALRHGPNPDHADGPIEMKHRYARWVPGSRDEYDLRFIWADGPGPGAFPVTVTMP